MTLDVFVCVCVEEWRFWVISKYAVSFGKSAFCIVVPFHVPQCLSVQVAPQPDQHLILSGFDFFFFFIATGRYRYFIMALSFILLVTWNMKHLFVGLFFIHVIFGKYVQTALLIVKNWVLFWLNFETFLCVLEVLKQMCLVQILFQSSWRFLPPIMVSEVFGVDKHHFVIFISFMVHAFVS